MTPCPAPALDAPALDAPVLDAADAPFTVRSEVLGPLAVSPADVLTFDDGVLGFPACRRFVLVPAGREGLYWLQSVEQTALAFLLVDPFPLVPGYSLDLGATASDGEAAGELAAATPADILALAILTLPATRAEPPTANLQGPLVIDLRTRRGRQVVVSSGEFGLRHPVDLSRQLAPC